MSIEEIAELLVNAKRPIEVFGGTTKEEVKKKYKYYVKICHPDLVIDSAKEAAGRCMELINDFYKRALKELEDGIYNITDKKELYKRESPIFEFDLKKQNYKFYEYMYSNDVCDIYEGLCNDKIVNLYIVTEESDNSLIEREYELLNKLEHLSIVKPISKIKINDKNGLIFEKVDGYNVLDLKKEYGNISGEHVCWILERLLSVIGYLHSNKIVHGNIKEENVIINPLTHNVYLKDFTLAIENANDVNSKYKIINEYFTPSYVNKNERVMPSADIYAVGKIAIDLLGGDYKNVALPLSCDVRVRKFIRKLVETKQNDAWALWDELIKIRNEVYGTKRFQILSKKIRRY